MVRCTIPATARTGEPMPRRFEAIMARLGQFSYASPGTLEHWFTAGAIASILQTDMV